MGAAGPGSGQDIPRQLTQAAQARLRLHARLGPSQHPTCPGPGVGVNLSGLPPVPPTLAHREASAPSRGLGAAVTPGLGQRSAHLLQQPAASAPGPRSLRRLRGPAQATPSRRAQTPHTQWVGQRGTPSNGRDTPPRARLPAFQGLSVQGRGLSPEPQTLADHTPGVPAPAPLCGRRGGPGLVGSLNEEHVGDRKGTHSLGPASRAAPAHGVWFNARRGSLSLCVGKPHLLSCPLSRGCQGPRHGSRGVRVTQGRACASVGIRHCG